MSESANTPTVVLVHGGFADASFWGPVIKDLQAHDLPVLARPNQETEAAVRSRRKGRWRPPAPTESRQLLSGGRVAGHRSAVSAAGCGSREGTGWRLAGRQAR
jgi:hypothetical protein